MAGVRDKELMPVAPWPAGIDNLSAEDDLARSDDGSAVIAARAAVNVDFDKNGWPSRRPGYAKRVNCQLGHSAWAGKQLPYLLFVDNGDLYAMATDESVSLIKASVSNRPMSYASVADRVYYTNGYSSGRIWLDGAVSDWGPECAAGQPAVAPAALGGMEAGRYQVAITYRSITGEEGGTPDAVTVDVPAGGGIQLSSIPQPMSSDITTIRIYLGPANGDMLYWLRDIPIGVSSVALSKGRQGVPLRTQFCTVMPPGQITRIENGRHMVADGRFLRWSPELRYGLTDLSESFIEHSERILLMEPVGAGGDGVGTYCSDETRTYWYASADPKKFTPLIAYPAPAVPGTSVRAPAKAFGFDATTEVVYWMAADGVGVVGLPSGLVVPLRENQVRAPTAETGASLYRERNGIRQIITSLQGTGPNRLAVQDRAVAHIVEASSCQ